MNSPSPVPAFRQSGLALLIVPCLLAGAPMTAAAMAAAAALSQTADTPVTVTPSWGSAPVGRLDTVAIDFSVTLADLGGVAILVGRDDVTALFHAVGSRRIEGRLDGLTVASGAIELTVMQVVSPTDWQTLATLPVVLDSSRRHFAINGSVGVGAQALGSSGAALAPARRSATDLSAAVGVVAEQAFDDAAYKVVGLVSGSGSRSDAVHDPSARGAASPQVDLVGLDAVAVVDSAWGRSQIRFGEVTLSPHPLLAPALGRRGISVTQQFNERFDFTLGVQAGSPLSGSRNLSGIEDDASRQATARIGIELLTARPGGLRVEFGSFDGDVRPRPAALTALGLPALAPDYFEAQRSRGWGWRVVGASADGRWQGEFNTALSRLQTDDGRIRSDSGARRARSASLSWHAVQAALIADTATDLALSWRHDDSQALYQSLGGAPPGDQRLDALAINAQLGALSLAGTVERGEDNVASIQALPKNRSQASTLNALLPTAALAGWAGPASTSASWAWLWPQLSAGWSRSHLFGDAGYVPIEISAADLPDLVVSKTRVGLQWSAAWATLAWRHALKNQDQRQALHATQDQRSRGQDVDLSFRPAAGVDLGLNWATMATLLTETGMVWHSNNLSLQGAWRWRPGLRLAATWVRSKVQEPAFAPASDASTRLNFNSLRLEAGGHLALTGWRDAPGVTADWFARWVRSQNRLASSTTNAAAGQRALQAGVKLSY
jgi:hypothetical protein